MRFLKDIAMTSPLRRGGAEVTLLGAVKHLVSQTVGWGGVAALTEGEFYMMPLADMLLLRYIFGTD